MDVEVARSSVLHAGELAGYTETPATKPDPSTEALRSNFLKCVHTDINIFTSSFGAHRADSPTFDAASSKVNAYVAVNVDQREVRRRFSVYQDPRTPACMLALYVAFLQTRVDATATLNQPKVTRFDPGVGTQSLGFSISITVATRGSSEQFYADILIAVRDRAGISLSTITSGNTFDRSNEIEWLRRMYDRVGDRAR